jgi:mRNA interferase RelE/StbE
MKLPVELSAQVVGFIRRLAPDPRQRLRTALRDLTQEKGDIRALEADLQGFYRLRVGRYRVVFHYQNVRGKRTIRCEYAEARSIVYEVFAQLSRHLQPPAP